VFYVDLRKKTAIISLYSMRGTNWIFVSYTHNFHIIR